MEEISTGTEAESEKNKMNPWFLCFLRSAVFLVCLYMQASSSSAMVNSIFAGQSLSGKQTITSPEEVFELGFFNPGNSQNYIGIWYKFDGTVVWVANRNRPISDPFLSSFSLKNDGNLVLSTNKSEIWSTNSTSETINSTVCELLDSGNLILRATSSGQILWQSFDHLTNTWLPDSKLGYNERTGETKILNSWNSSTNPSAGFYSAELGPSGLSLLVESRQYWLVERLGFLHDVKFFSKNLTYGRNGSETYLTYSPSASILTRIVLETTGQLQQLQYIRDQWHVVWRRPAQVCGSFGFNLCGDFSICNENRDPVCACLQGFTPNNPSLLDLVENVGCKRTEELQCEGGRGVTDNFLRLSNIQYLFQDQFVKVNNTIECESACSNDCSCSGFYYDNVCFLWKGQVEGLRQFSPDDLNSSTIDFYFRVAVLDHEVDERRWIEKLSSKIVVGSIVVLVFCLSCFIFVFVWIKRAKSRALSEISEDSLMVLSYQELQKSTKNFAELIGEGAFGRVYKGELSDSSSSAFIAVKKLSTHFQTQSLKQFRAEVSTIGAIQHINLVQLRGFCVRSSHRFLVYEYMPNGSLASRLFRKEDHVFLSWSSRYNIALGVAKGMAYLHENCRDCIIHCDIKPENILLDEDYNPKVADFGLAKLVGRDFSRVLTTIRGTRGYLAPEWMSGEAITHKVDVFSYGKLLFEIISGKRNMGMAMEDMENYFPAVVANALQKGDDLKAVLEYKVAIEKEGELIRACKVACWCVHDDEKCRPSMSQVVGVLEGFVELGLPPISRFYQSLIDGSQYIDGTTTLVSSPSSSSSSL